MDQEKIQRLFEKGVLVHQDFLEQPLSESLLERLELEADLLVLNSDYAQVLTQSRSLVDWYELDGCRVAAEQDRNEDLYQHHLQEFRHASFRLPSLPPAPSGTHTFSALEVQLQPASPSHFITEPGLLAGTGNPSLPFPPTLAEEGLVLPSSEIKIVFSYQNVPRKYEVRDFTSLFTSRYLFLEKLLRSRQELQNILTISRILAQSEKEKVSAIGVILEIAPTKNGNYSLLLEDLTGQLRVIATKNKPEILMDTKELVVDEIIGISGAVRNGVMFADRIVWPDLPAGELKRNEGKDEYAVFLSDIHVGSALFLREEFERFLQWINGNAGNEEQREIARKARYIFMVGDLVDGVGVYPAQEPELEIKDIREQYAEFVRLVQRLPPAKQIIICPGNHDAVHLAEPQPVLYKDHVQELFRLPNITLVTNPAMVNIGRTETFPGFDVLMYHGYSFDYYVANVESIRAGGGYQRADLIMKFLLKRRHLAPAFKSTPYFPGHSEDPLLIRRVPDFFVTGHIHYSSVANYKGVTMISCSCWQGKTSFQEKLGHKPEPARLPVVNLRTREVKVLRFG